ncbi:hypothetical protein AN214_04036 [Pseudoalteromonas sp. P1-9]|nr:hypothetical protein AN214_04036 [Pseudoalteromonas sp. P1-9]
MNIFGLKGSLQRGFILIQLALSVLVSLTALTSWFNYGMTLPAILFSPAILCLALIIINAIIKALRGLSLLH